MSKKFTIAIGSIVALLALIFVTTASANQLYLPIHSNCTTATATTSSQTLATTTPTYTLTCDSYSLDPRDQTPTAIDSAALAIQWTPVANADTLTFAYQYSTDAIDWYDDNLGLQASVSATSTITNKNATAWVSGGTTNQKKIVQLRTPTRYVRVVFSRLTGAATSTVWAEIIPQKQAKQ